MKRLSPDAYMVAVPSYKRADRVQADTLTFLREGGVPMGRVILFLNENEPDPAAYLAAAERFGCGIQTVPASNIQDKRKAISQAFVPGVPVVSLDDDVTALLTPTSDRKRLVPLTNVDEWFREAFATTDAADLFVWGVAPSANAFYMRPGYSDGLKFLIACCFGFYSRPGHPFHDITLMTKDDYEMSLLAWWFDGGAVRFNDVAAKADLYKAPGGCADLRTRELTEDCVEKLIARWPGLVRRNTKRKSDYPEILLAPRRRTVRHASLPG